MSVHVVITGGSGFIGSHLVRLALAHGDVRVTNLDALTYAAVPGSLADVEDDPRYHFVHGDVRDAEVVARAVTDADAVVHAAAESHVDRSIDGPQTFLETNVVGSGVVFEACRRAGVPRVLYVSTDEVYGSIAAPGRFSEDDPLRPTSPYAVSKAAADLLARSYATTYGYPISVTRSANTFGPHQLPEKVIPLFVTRLLDGCRVPLYGDGSQVREWTSVEDTAAAQWLVLTDGEPGGVYNVGSGDHRTNRDLTLALLARFGLHGDAAAARIEHVGDRPGHDARYALDTARIRTLGWQPTRSFDDALQATVDWYRAHEAWWRPLVEAGISDRQGVGR